jgi:hypothetical protein
LKDITEKINTKIRLLHNFSEEKKLKSLKDIINHISLSVSGKYEEINSKFLSIINNLKRKIIYDIEINTSNNLKNNLTI